MKNTIQPGDYNATPEFAFENDPNTRVGENAYARGIKEQQNENPPDTPSESDLLHKNRRVAENIATHA